jgi:tetratricopeptide (TPR) repeat protein
MVGEMTVIPSSLIQLLQRGLTAHQEGRLDEAISAYREALKIAPNHKDGLHLLGVALGAQGRVDEGIETLLESLRQDRRQPDCLFNLGNLWLQKGSFANAAACYGDALALDQKMSDAWANLALARQGQGAIDQARMAWQKSLQYQPRNSGVWLRLAQSYHDARQLNEAEAVYRAGSGHNPRDASLACNLGNVLRELHRDAEAAECYRRATGIDPNSHEAWNNLGVALQGQGLVSEAVVAFEKSVAIKPDYAEAFSNLGPALQRLNRVEEAIATCQRALELHPDHDGAWVNLGNALLAANRVLEAAKAYAKAEQLKPDNATAKKNEGIARLLSGDLARGFELFEARWNEPEFLAGKRHFVCPRWTGGEPLEGRSLLLHLEQGLGDAIQFARYVPLLARRGARVFLESPAALIELFEDLPGVAGLVRRGDPLPATDYHCPLLSVAHAMGTALADIPSPGAYLQPKPDRVQAWKPLVDGISGPKIGVVWSGNPNHKNDHNRSIPFSFFRRLFESIPARFVSLQMEVKAEEQADVADTANLRHPCLTESDFAVTAGLVQQLDLVVTVDSSVAHLAGALGRPVWILLPYAPDWRWLLKTDRSPWYPSARLFRQPRTGDWLAVVDDVVAEMRLLFPSLSA